MADTNDKKSPFKPAAEAIAALGELLTAARHMKALTDSLLEAGYSEADAIYLTGCAIGGARKT